MFNRRFFSFFLVLCLASSAVVPWVAQGDVSLALIKESLTGGGAAESGDADGGGLSAEEAAATKKRKGNGLGRAIGAPFRALARLFGGGGKRDKAAKPVGAEEKAAPTVARADAPVEGEAILAPAPRPAEVGRAAVFHAAGTAPATEEGAGVPAPAVGGGAAAQPAKPWVPHIRGVPNDPLTQGRALLERGHVNEAISELSVAAASVGAGANLVEANNLLGLAYARLGRHSRAVESYRRALTVAPNDAAVLANLGNSLYLSDDIEGAHQNLKRAARLSPGMAPINHSLGVVQARRGKHGDAFKSFARAGGEYDAHLRLAAILEAQRQDKKALKHYEAALRLQPNTTAVLERLTALYERTGQRDKAETARRALGQPANPQRTTTGGG